MFDAEIVKDIVSDMQNHGISHICVSDKNSELKISISSNSKKIFFSKENLMPNKATEESISKILSPSVGVFFKRHPNKSKDLVSINEEVKVGQIIGLVLCHDIFIPVRSKFCGILKEFIAENGISVEYNTPIITIKGT